jgi:hypothetical protein
MGERYAAHALLRAYADQTRAAEQVIRYERARLTHVPAYQAALAMLSACDDDVKRAYAALSEYRTPMREANP